MENEILFYIFSALAVGGALGVILVKGYVNAAMSMLLSILGISALMILMKAYFVGLLMVMVYAGAIMVLFVFIAMLVGGHESGAKLSARIKLAALWALTVGAGAWLADTCPEFFGRPAAGGAELLADSKNYGLLLFSKYMLHFQIAGALLLAAMVGVIVIAKDKAAPKKYKRDLL